jgi:hypothetical protein
MKYLNKYNEGIFSSKKVDKQLVEKVKKWIEDNYNNAQLNEEDNKTIIEFTHDDVDYKVVLSIDDDYQKEKGIGKLTKVFSKPDIRFSLIANNHRLNSVSMSEGDFYTERISDEIINNISHYVNNMKTDKLRKAEYEKEKEELKSKTISKDDLEDVVVSLSDICDDYEIKENFVKRTDGRYFYLVKFTKKELGFNFKEIKSIIGSRSYGDPKIQIDNLENLKLIIEELDNIKYALKEGWDLDVNIYIKDNSIEMEVYEASKK